MLLSKLQKEQKTDTQNWQLPYQTKSLCPVCLQIIDAEVYIEDDTVMMSKDCQKDGTFRELISSDIEFFLKMRRTHYERPIEVENPNCRDTAECPNGCGLCEEHLSRPAMVNIDLTNRCNQNCPICFANSNAVGRVYEATLEQVKEMLDRIKNIRPAGPSCLQFVGGEPTIHKDFVECVRQAKIRDVGHVQVASNGQMFAKNLEFCHAASDAGLDQVYLQFDGLDDDIYLNTRGRKLVEIKLQAVENLRKANVRVVLVPTILKGLNDSQVGNITQFAIENTDIISGISWQPVAITGRIDETQRRQMRYTMADLARDLQQSGVLDMHRDWYPFSVVSPFLKLMSLIENRPQFSICCHPHCGCATYLVVDKKTKIATPLPEFIDIEPAMQTLDKMATRIENHPWLKNVSALAAMRSMKKHFHKDKAPQGWGFDEFMNFVRSFVEFSDQHADKKAFTDDLSQQRFGTLLMASMHFQDAYNYDINRSKHCVVLYAAPNGRFYPFCTWNSGPCHRYDVEKAYSKPLHKKEEITVTTD